MENNLQNHLGFRFEHQNLNLKLVVQTCSPHLDLLEQDVWLTVSPLSLGRNEGGFSEGGWMKLYTRRVKLWLIQRYYGTGSCRIGERFKAVMEEDQGWREGSIHVEVKDC